MKNSNQKISLSLLTLLMMFPQIVETIYSPALTHIAQDYNVSAKQAGQTLSIYFFAFAFGVVFWGRICDLLGRRPAMLGGLILYTIASVFALCTQQFEMLLLARMLSAFGAAVGSVVVQTMIRDGFRGNELAKVFAVMGIALAVSPGIGMVTGTVLTSLWGYQGVFAALAFLAFLLFVWSVIKLPETREKNNSVAPLVQTFVKMFKDIGIWRTSFLVAFFNINLFGYYQLAPFHFQSLGLAPEALGYSGLLLTLGVIIGAWTNKLLLKKGFRSSSLVVFSALIAIVGGLLLALLLFVNNKVFALPMLLVVIAYGVAIPNILACALTSYTNCLGTAGAILGMFYYLLLGGGLALASLSQHLGLVLVVSSCLALPLAYWAYRAERCVKRNS